MDRQTGNGCDGTLYILLPDDISLLLKPHLVVVVVVSTHVRLSIFIRPHSVPYTACAIVCRSILADRDS